MIIFSFAFNMETKEATFSGNITPMVALQVLQSIVVAEAVKNEKASITKPNGS